MKKISFVLLLTLLFTTGCGARNNTQDQQKIKQRKIALGAEGLELVEGAQAAYLVEQLENDDKISSKSTVCFSLQWLHNNDYFMRGTEDGYTGSVLVKYENDAYTYSFWISNGKYAFEDVSPTSYNYELAQEKNTASENCEGEGYQI